VSDASKKARRDRAREHARELRDKEKKKKRRNRFLIQGGVVVVVLAAATIIFLFVTSIKPAVVASGVGPLNMISDGILLKGESGTISPVATKAIPKKGTPVATDPSTLTAPVYIATYIDYQCPACQAFELTNGSQIQSWLSQGQIELEIHPIQILDRSSLGTRYSSRAANASACVANFDPNKFFDITMALYAQDTQPKEGTSGLSNDQIKKVISDAGATGADVASCIDNESFKAWVTAASDRATKGPLPNTNGVAAQVTGTPMVLVNGQTFTGDITDAAAFSTFVGQVAAGN
jgi:protein-disulfide isomerase